MLLHCLFALADSVCDQGGHPQIKKKKKIVGIYKFKKYEFAKVPILIFVLNSHFRFRKKKKINKGDKSIEFTVNNPNNPKL